MRELSLNGEWKLTASRVEENNYGIRDGSSFVMRLPGSVQDALIDQAVVPDPYLGCNAKGSCPAGSAALSFSILMLTATR